MKKPLAIAALILAASSAQAAESCGKVTIADMNWNSATLIAHVDKFILQHGFGCDAELIPGDTMPTSTSMIEKSQPDIAPELWTNSFKEALEKAVKEKRLTVAGKVLSDGGEEGFWVPKYMVDKEPSLATIQGIKAHADMFPDPEDPSKSAFMGCPAGWGCQITASNLFKALDLKSAGFELRDPGSAAGLDGSIARAYERKKPWFGYYWAPTAILGKYKMVKVDFGTGVDEKEFISCITQADCEHPKATMYPPSPVYTYTTSDFAKNHKQIFDYLAHRAYSNDELNELLAWMEANQADGGMAMEHFLRDYGPKWKAWLPKDVADRVQKALDNL